MRTLLVGEAPGRTGNGRPLEGALGRRIASLAGLSFESYLRSYQRTNVLDYWPGAGVRGARFPISEAWIASLAIEVRVRRQYRTVVLLGKRVRRAFGLEYLDYFEKYKYGRATIVVIPHPSGINRWFNSEENRRYFGNFMRALARRR